MSQANVRIDIASEFTGRKAFTDAERATNSLEKSVTRLGTKLAGAFSAYKIAQYAKISVKAFAEDQKAAAVLAKTLDNVNQGYQTEIVNAYIAKTEALYGVLDDKLRPAFSQLVIATGDATKSQQLLQTALDVSAGTGKDVLSVTAALSKAYLGNNTALQRLGVGLSAAELKGKSFDQIITTLNQNFAGQAATAADTYQGKIDRLNVAFANMQETVGKGIIDALGQLNTDQGFNGVITKIGSLAQDIADITVGLGVVVGKLQSLPGAGVVKNILGASFNTGLLGILKNIGAKERTSKAQSSVVTNFLNDMNRIAAATAKSNANLTRTVNLTKTLTKEQKDQLALKKASLALEQSQNIFNLDRIEVAAAMQNKQTAEDMARLKLKQDIFNLEDAINSKNAELATKIVNVLNADAARLKALQDQKTVLDSIVEDYSKLIDKEVKITFTSNGMPSLTTPSGAPSSRANVTIPDIVKEAVSSVATTIAPSIAAAVEAVATTPPVVAATNAAAKIADGLADIAKTVTNTVAPVVEQTATAIATTTPAPNQSFAEFVAASAGVSLADLAGLGDLGFINLPTQQAPVTVTIVDNTSGLIDVITDATQQASANGINTRLVRNTGGLNW